MKTLLKALFLLLLAGLLAAAIPFLEFYLVMSLMQLEFGHLTQTF